MTAYARRRAISTAVIAAAALAFVALTFLRAQPPRPAIESFPALSPERARAQLRGCAYREDPVHAEGFIDTVVAGADRMPAADRLTLASGRVAILGWSLFEHPLRPVDGVIALVDGRCAAASVIRQSRPDVATVLKDARADAAGFTLVLEPARLPKGSHRVVLYAIDARRHARAQLGAPSVLTIR